jgi:hypothetical protein
MPISHAFAFLIPPGKSGDQHSEISCKSISSGPGKLFEMLTEVFSGQDGSQDFEISFNPSSSGKQYNKCRELFIEFVKNPSKECGITIAKRLCDVTDKRSGVGLLFILVGNNGLNKRLVVSRFPTDQAILAEIGDDGLAVEFLEQVFIKRLSSYKAVRLDHQSPSDGFWTGIATDRQAGRSGEHISEYWLKDFLDADFSETPAAGTRRLASALKGAIKASPNSDVKAQIAHASSLAPAVFSGKSISIDQFCDHFGFSAAAKETVKNQLSKPGLSSKKFKFDEKEFKNTVLYRTIEINNGAILTAPNEDFENVFSKEEVSRGVVKFITQGQVRDQRLAKR